MERVLPQLEALLEAGHAVHLGIGGRPSGAAPAIAGLSARFPRLSIGYAVGRSDSWEVVAGRLREAVAEPGPGRPSPHAAASMATALPADPGVVSYLRQLDVELVLLTGEMGPGAFASEYLSACRSLGMACAELAPTPDAAVAQAAAPVAMPTLGGDSATFLWRPALWAMRIGHAATRLGDQEEAVSATLSSDGQGLKARLGAVYAASVFPRIAALGPRLAPASRPLLKARLAGGLDPVVLTNEMSAEAAMARAAQGEGPVVFGPWTGDPDLEFLYWVPFLRWFRRRYSIDKERIISVSRGGSSLWYAGLGTYLDVSELFDEQAQRTLDAERRQELARRGKNFGVTDADRQVFKRLDRRLAFRGFNVLPPWALHLLFERYWSGETGLAFLTEHTRHQSLNIKEKRARQLYPSLPHRYLVMSFEPPAGASANPGAPAFAAELVREAARAMDVVILASEGRGGDLRAQAGDVKGVHWIELDARTAQGVGSVLVAGGQAFLGAQNWLAYVAASVGKPAFCFQPEADARSLVHRVSAEIGFGMGPTMLGAPEADSLRRAVRLATLRGETAVA